MFAANWLEKNIFTILDEKDGGWQIKLDEPSSKLWAFNTPWGRYRFLRLLFGIKSASEVFQQKNCEIYSYRSKARATLLQCANSGGANFEEKQETSEEDTFQSV